MKDERFKVRSVCSMHDCIQLQKLLNSGYVIVRADTQHGNGHVIYILERK